MKLLIKTILLFKIFEIAASSDVSNELTTKTPDSSISSPQCSKNIYPVASSSDKSRSAKEGHVEATKESKSPLSPWNPASRADIQGRKLIVDKTSRSANEGRRRTSKKSKLPSLPADSASWVIIRNRKLGYVDKTSYLLKLLRMRSTQFLIVRPRRFGKSVFVEMLKDFFCGRKGRFTNLEIAKVGNVKYMENMPASSKKKWLTFPVIHLNLENLVPFESLQQFGRRFRHLLRQVADHYKISYELEDIDLGYLIRELHLKFESLPVVVLIDEYDAPVERALRTLKNKTLASEIIEYLDQVFSKIKNNRNEIGFAFITGICKLSLQSMASGSEGAFEDLTNDPEMATAFGFTIREITNQLSPFLDKFAENKSKSSSLKEIKTARGKIIENLIEWYDGYHFNEEDPNVRVLNPVSTCRSLDEYKFADYWGQTGNVNFIVKTFYESKNQWQLPDFKRPKGYTMNLRDIPRKGNRIDTLKASLPVLMLSYGYLTYKMCDMKQNTVTLLYPNLEVEHYLENALSKYVPQTEEPNLEHFRKFLQSMGIGNIEEALRILRNFEFIIYSHPSKKDATPAELTRRLNSLLHLSGIIFREGVDFTKDRPTSKKKEHGGEIDFLTLNLKVNYAISVKCTSHTIGNATGAIGQLIDYLEGETSNPESFNKALKELNVETEKLYLLGLGFTYVDGGTLDNWIFLPYKDGQIRYAEVHTSSQELKDVFLNTYAQRISTTSRST